MRRRHHFESPLSFPAVEANNNGRKEVLRCARLAKAMGSLSHQEQLQDAQQEIYICGLWIRQELGPFWQPAFGTFPIPEQRLINMECSQIVYIH